MRKLSMENYGAHVHQLSISDKAKGLSNLKTAACVWWSGVY